MTKTPPITKTPPPPKSVDIYNTISQSIINGTLKANEKLNEQSLANHFGTSRGPIREALRKLESKSLVSFVPNVGVRIQGISLKKAEDLLSIRLVLECMAVESACHHITDDEIQGLYDLLDSHAQRIYEKNDGAYITQNENNDFHKAIIQASHNAYLQEILNKELYVRLQICRHQHTWKQRRADEALHEHRQILDAINDRDSELASLFMKRHLQYSHDNILETIKQKNTQDTIHSI